MIFIETRAKEEMIKDAIDTFPDECCGFIFGKEEEGRRSVTTIRTVNNSSEENKKRRFRIDPRDYLQAEKWAEENKVDLLGVYHSHPDHPAIPSEQDRIMAQPYFSYIIISVINRNWADNRSWRLDGQDQFEEEKITDK